MSARCKFQCNGPTRFKSRAFALRLDRTPTEAVRGVAMIATPPPRSILGQCYSKSSLNRTTLLGVRRGVRGVLGVLQSTLWSENCTPDLELLLARTTSCWPPGSAGYKLRPHQSTTHVRKLYDVAPQSAGDKSICLPESCSSWDDSMPASDDWSRISSRGDLGNVVGFTVRYALRPQ